jgi:hypothetical protein
MECSSSSIALVLVLTLSAAAAAPAAAQRGNGATIGIVRLRWKGQDEPASLAVHTHPRPRHLPRWVLQRQSPLARVPGRATRTLPFSGSYRDLIGRLANDLPLGPTAAKQAARPPRGRRRGPRCDAEGDDVRAAAGQMMLF